MPTRSIYGTTRFASSQSGATWPQMLTFIAASIVIAVIAVGATYWVTGSASATNNEPAQAQADTPIQSPEIVKFEPFTVNVRGPKNRILYIDLNLKVASKQAAKRLAAHKVALRSRLLTELSSQKGQSLETAEGKQKLAEKLKITASQPFVQGREPLAIQAVLFSNFVMH